MTDAFDSFGAFEPILLVATFDAAARAAYRDRVWDSVFGSGEAPWERLSEEDQPSARQSLSDALLGHLVTHQLYQVQTRNRDEPLPVLLNFFPVSLPDEKGALKVRAVTVMGEVLAEPTSWTVNQTQRHRMETLGRMTMGIAHDFNNLLSGILGHTELIKSTLTDKIPAEFTENLRTVEQAAQDGAALIRKIQQYIRQEKQDRFEALNINDIIQDCVAFTKPYWYNEPRRQGISIEAYAVLNEVPPVHGSATELREVFVNLILNAVQAMPGGGEIRFETSTDAKNGVAISVKDTGTGMPENVRRKIFEPLFTTKGASGTGMGLAVSYGIIQEHDGAIDVASEIGQGTTFTITFPSTPSTGDSAAPSVQRGTNRNVRILVVDDEPMVRTVLNRLLSLNGHAVTLADSGAAALSLLGQQEFDIVFTDNGMPEMNGRQLARAIRSQRPSLPIALLTGDTEAGDIDRDVNAVLGKPFKLEQLEAAIQRLCG